MSHALDRNRILDLWMQGKTGPEIGDIIGHHNTGSISRLVSKARADGDARAVARQSARAEKLSQVARCIDAPKIAGGPPLHELLGIKTRQVEVPIFSHTSNAVTYARVTLPSLGRFDPEGA